MSDTTDKESKTEDATEKKIRDTVEQGKLPASREIPIFASFLACLIFTVFFAADGTNEMGMFLSRFLERPEEWPLETGNDVLHLYGVVVAELGKVLGTLLLLMVIAGVGASVVQNLPQFVGERIAPKFSHISLVQGWKRLFGVQGLVEFAKSVAKLTFVTLILVLIFRHEHIKLLAGMLTQPAEFGLVIRQSMIDVLKSIVFVMAVIAGFDLVWSRYHWLQELRMSKQEIKDEMKQAEGDPIIKARLRSLARDRLRKRMMAAVPQATLVIANPTHYAIALRYVRDQDTAPVVVAKGQDLIALKIREIAEANGIPVFEDVALARSMYKQVSVDSVIPNQFYQAVAEFVRIVYAKKPQRKDT